ncbi:MAG: DUF4105 domain-containing protein [Parvularculales bacterium]
MAFFFLCLTARVAEAFPQSVHFDRLNSEASEHWQTLNYYHQTSDDLYISEIVNSEFFLSPEGAHNPQAELEAFVQLLEQSKYDKTARLRLCDFPARIRFVKKHLVPHASFPQPSCEEYLRKNRPDKITSISLVYASGYYDNPASYFGHALIRLNYDNLPINQTSLDSGINYGASLPNDVSMIAYVAKGLTGGFTGSYQRNNHFIHGHHYTNREIRDLWEYRLNLTPEEQRFVVEHSWEIRHAKFRYYFFNDNCAHRIARMINMATGNHHSDNSHGFWMMPMQVVRGTISRNNMASKTFIAEEIYHPSLRKRFTDQYEYLPSDKQHQLINFLGSSQTVREEKINALNPELRLLALDYLDLQIARQTIKSKDKDKMHSLQTQRSFLLRSLMTEPAEHVVRDAYDTRTPNSPLDSNAVSSLRLTVGMRDSESFARLGYRIANNDFLTAPNPGQEASTFIVADMETELSDDSIEFHKFTLLDLKNINTNPLPLSLTGEFSWSFKINYAARNNLCTDCKRFNLEGGIGTATRLNQYMMLYGLTGINLHNRSNDNEEPFSSFSELGVVLYVNEYIRATLTSHYEYDPLENRDWKLFKANASYDIRKNNDIRFSVESDLHNTTALVSIGYYFD